MTRNLAAELKRDISLDNAGSRAFRFPILMMAVAGLGILLAATGCQTPRPSANELPTNSPDQPQSTVLREGDVLKISFPSAPNLDTTPRVGMDGKITLKLVGDVKAAGLTRDELKKEIVESVRLAARIKGSHG